MPEQIRLMDQLVWEYAITLPPAPGDGKEILVSVKRYAPTEQIVRLYTTSANGQRNPILELGADGTPGFARLDHPEAPTTLIVRMLYRESRGPESLPWRDSALKLVYNGPETLISHGNPQFRDNRIVLGAQIRPQERIAAGDPLRWSDLRMNLSFNGSTAEVRSMRAASAPEDAEAFAGR